MAKVTVVYHSGKGHTQKQAEAVVEGAASVSGVQAELLEAALAIEKLDDLDQSDAIIFGCPTYMGNISAGMKQFIEAAARKWFTLAWRNKIAGAFTNSSSFSGDKLNTLQGLVTNALQHGMIYVGMALLPSANEPEGMQHVEGPSSEALNRVGSFTGPMAASFQLDPDTAPSDGDLETARLYGQRVAEVTVQFLRGAGS